MKFEVQLEALLARVEAATGADEALDLAIAQAMKEPIAYFRLVGEDGAGASTAPYTSSLDAALALVERRGWSVHAYEEGRWFLRRRIGTNGAIQKAGTPCATMTLSLLSALLRAEIARGGGE